MKHETKVILTASGIALVSFYIYFNRNPDRIIQPGIVSPADGTIKIIDNNRIEIFIGITDVHFQRAPASGIITDIKDYPDENKNFITMDNGLIIERRGGILARSVRTFVKVGDRVEKGQFIGRILLGSHCAISPITNPIVRVGQHVLAGQTLQL